MKINEMLREDLTSLRDELQVRAFDVEGYVIDSTLAEVVWKINSCLYSGYPRRKPSYGRAADALPS